MKRRVFGCIAVAIVIAAFASACRTTGGVAADALSLEGTQWVLLAYRKTSPIEGTEITATFEDGQIAGSAGCNSYFGAYEARGGDINIGPIAQTEMACMDPVGVMDQETEYLGYLSQAQTFRFDGAQLLIYWDEHEALTFLPRE
jgi:heat shock protein HslJ